MAPSRGGEGESCDGMGDEREAPVDRQFRKGSSLFLYGHEISIAHGSQNVKVFGGSQA